MRKKTMLVILGLLLLCLLFAGAALAEENASPAQWRFGFGRRQIIPQESGMQPLYIAGYHNGVEISGVLDWCEARAVWLDTGGEGVLFIGLDCIAVDSATVRQIRSALGDLPGCAAVVV